MFSFLAKIWITDTRLLILEVFSIVLAFKLRTQAVSVRFNFENNMFLISHISEIFEITKVPCLCIICAFVFQFLSNASKSGQIFMCCIQILLALSHNFYHSKTEHLIDESDFESPVIQNITLVLTIWNFIVWV